MKLAIFLWLVLAGTSYSFPQNTRLGYINCKSCHISPSGGGALSGYGKSTAGELSTIALESEFKKSAFISGGDIRYLWTKSETPEIEYEDRFLMQADAELGFQYKNLTLVAQYGQYKSYPQNKEASYKHYMMYYIEKANLTLRAGKFTPAFGINSDDHTLPGRNSLRLGSRDASYNLELVAASKYIVVTPTLIMGCQGGYTDAERMDYCDNGETGAINHIAFQPYKYLYLSGSVGVLQKEGETRYLNAIGWVIGNKYFYSIGEYANQKIATMDHGDDEGFKDQGWIDLVGSYKGFDLGFTHRKYLDRDENGIKMRWLPISGLELTVTYLEHDDVKKVVSVAHVYF